MPFKLKPTSQIVTRLGLGKDGRVLNFFASECAKAMDKYVPMDEGTLRQYQIEGNYIIYNQPYARYQYYGIREDGTHVVMNYTTPGTGSYWDKRMKSAEMSDIEKRVQVFVGGKQ